MIIFKNPSEYKHIQEIKRILGNEKISPLLKSGNFKELYDLLLKSDISSIVIGEITKFLYTALKIDLLDTLSEVPDIFLNSTDLIKIEIPNHITTINDYSFAFNDNLKEVILPSNLTILGVSCFLGSPELKEITIPKSLKKIKSRAFEKCPKLNNIYYKGTFGDFLKIIGNRNLADNDGKIHCTDATLYFSHIKDRWIDLDSEVFIP